jgi:peptidoglycan/LPS O-acetylase OafA/YrhL
MYSNLSHHPLPISRALPELSFCSKLLSRFHASDLVARSGRIISYFGCSSFAAYPLAGIVMLFIFLLVVSSFCHSVFIKNKLMLAMAWVGVYSYAIYLFHFFVGPGAVNSFQRHVRANAPLFVRFMVFTAAGVFFGFSFQQLLSSRS